MVGDVVGGDDGVEEGGDRGDEEGEGAVDRAVVRGSEGRADEDGREDPRGAVGGADAPDPLAEFDTWRGTEPEGRVKTEREYVENPYRTLTLSLSLPPQAKPKALPQA